MHCLLTLAQAEQRKLCLPLKPEEIWYALTPVTIFDPAEKAVLAQRGNAVAVFKPCSHAVAAKGGWRRASFKTVKTKEHWTSGPSGPALLLWGGQLCKAKGREPPT